MSIIPPGNEAAPPPPGGRHLGSELTENLDDIRLTHTMIRISDPKKSLDFYTGLLRMSFLFSMNAGPFTIYFLGHPDRADQSAADIMKDGTRTGLLELIHLTTTADDTVGAEWGNAGAPQTLGHLGFRVPDVNALLERAQLGGHKVLKTVPHIPSTAVGIHEGVGVQGLHPSFLQGYSQIGFIADPDGHCVEILPASLG